MSESGPEHGSDAGRMEALSDGVIAIIVTIMVLELRPPEEASANALLGLWPVFLSYLLSFSLVAVYWFNHHGLLRTARRVGSDTLWLNLHFLFWLSLFPFATSYIGETRGASFAVALYAGLSTIVALAFFLLTRSLTARNAHIDEVAGRSRSRFIKNFAALGCMIIAIPLAFVSEPLAIALLVVPVIAYALPER